MANYDFPPSSRYYAIEMAALRRDDDTVVPYLRRRFLPQVESFSLLHEHRVVEGERPDHIAAAELGDAEAFWRLCDANGAMHPRELVDAIGKVVRIALPQGMPGPARE
ncbi:hypothetical protein HEP74_04008 [Xanthomonas sp. SS]|uniref:LysM domain-containing protein n=1 Tax=Xanthomonas sp. SS TaxID=2724122 RepID=UPI00163ABA41|nr:LysM domain-containing protein [Xanthomonas sp. SS]QNH18832.1 hypothetical protein HEP74_04008 [Xanthomonas sp. SS]